MQVYMVTWDGQIGQPDCFRNFADIEPSIRTSFSGFDDLQITKKPTNGPVEFVVTYTKEGEKHTETLIATRYPVWDSPTHL